jgi:hypothetical protein
MVFNAWSCGRSCRERGGWRVHCGMGDGMEDQWSSVCCHSLRILKFSSDRRRLIFDEISRGILGEGY